MPGIGPAIKTTGITGGTKNGAKPGSLNAKNNSKKSVSKLSAADLTDAEKKIKEGDASDEVANTEEEKNTGETTEKVDNKAAAKKAASPKEKLFSEMDEMSAKLADFKKQNDGGIANAQQFGAQAQAQKDAQEMAKLAALQQAKQPKASSTPSPKASQAQQKKSSSSSNTAARKNAENNKKLQEQNKQIAENQKKLGENQKKLAEENKQLKEKLKDSTSKKVKDTAENLGTKDNSKTESARSSGSKAIPLDKVDKVKDFVEKAKSLDLSADEQKKVLSKLDDYVEKTGDKNLTNIRDDYAKHIEKGKDSDKRSVDDVQALEFNSQKELNDYDNNSFSLDEDLSINTETESKELENKLEDHTDKLVEDAVEAAEIEELEEEQEEEDLEIPDLDFDDLDLDLDE